MKKKLKFEDFNEIQSKATRLEALINLSKDMAEKERRLPIPFNDFLYLASCNPESFFRNIYQLFHDMVHYYVGEGVEEYPDSENSIGFVGYDCSNLFIKDCDNPFFADRLFANRLMNLIDTFKEGSLKNYIYLFEGPAGSGKSTFLNNILFKLEEYTRTSEGTIYKTYWKIDIEKLGGIGKFESMIYRFPRSSDELGYLAPNEFRRAGFSEYPKKYLEFSCPKHDHPILQIPKSYRKKFLDELIPDEKFKEKLFTRKEYEWVLKDIPCNICRSLFSSLLDELNNPLEVFMMINARKAQFNRQFGEGISVFNPGDPINKKPITNFELQSMINSLFKNDVVNFVYSDLAKTNNGVFALMDIKDNNVERLKYLHGIISDGVHKVELIEEHIRSIFLGVINPEDKIHYETVKSFQDRVITVNIPYILDYNTEVAIYKNKFGEEIESKFLPQVLKNFAKIIISTRMNLDSPAIRKWIKNPEIYRKYLDKNLLLLKMDIYTGKIPEWLTELDLKRFDRQMRKEVLADTENEGNKGISGRMSLNVFNSFYSKYGKRPDLISMDALQEFFTDQSNPVSKLIPTGFIDSLIDMYDYNVLQEVKEAIYQYNEKQISNDIINYLFSINFEPDTVEICHYTGDKIEITEDYFKNFEATILGVSSTKEERLSFRKDALNTYIAKTLAQEIQIKNKNIRETEQFKTLFEKYTRILKENVLLPYVNNNNFRMAIIAYGTPQFDTFDNRIKQDVTFMLNNLVNKFGYTIEGAKQIGVYVLDKKLVSKY